MATVFTTTRCLLRNSSRIREKCVVNILPKRTILTQTYKSINRPTCLFNCTLKNSFDRNILLSRCVLVKFYSRPADKPDKYVPPPQDDEGKLTLFQRFKQMYRDYWYVLVPVHLATSACWFGGFYYLAKSGIDIVGIMESWNVSQVIINPLKDSSMGYIAVSYALYKIFTPLRYTVTLGGTTISIKYLKEWGYIKPVPTSQEIRDLYKEKRDNLLESMKEKKDMYQEKKENIIQQMKGKKEELMQKKDELKIKKDDLMGDFENSLRQMKEETKKDIENTIRHMKEETQNIGAKPAHVISDVKNGKKNKI